jgi:hypothetical protein
MKHTLTKPQGKVWAGETRFKVLICGRRWGKTYLALLWLIAQASVGSDSLNYYIAPTYKQAKNIAWRLLKQLLGTNSVKTNESELYVELPNGAIIQLVGADNPDTLRGVSLASAVMDEFCFMSEDVWKFAVRPATSDRQAPVLFISSPAGWNWGKDLYDYAVLSNDPNWEAFQYTTAEGGNVKLEEIEASRRELPASVFKQEYLASFVTLANQVYSNFDPELNILPKHPDVHNFSDIHVGIDFNVGIMSAIVSLKIADELHVFDEVMLPNSNTTELALEINRRWPNHNIYCYPDPSGRARKSSAIGGVTDFTILRNAGFYVVAPSKHPPIADRINEVQALLANADGIRRLYVHKQCHYTLKALQGLTYNINTGMPDKTGGLDHACFSGDTLVRVNGTVHRFDEIPSSGTVETITGEKPYTKAGLVKKDQRMVIVYTDVGDTIVCTRDHKFLTSRGWLEARLLEGQILVDQEAAWEVEDEWELEGLEIPRPQLDDLLTTRVRPNRIVSEVLEAPNEDVYCLTVKQGHFLLPNGLIVSNSDGLGYMIHSVFPFSSRVTRMALSGF